MNCRNNYLSIDYTESSLNLNDFLLNFKTGRLTLDFMVVGRNVPLPNVPKGIELILTKTV